MKQLVVPAKAGTPFRKKSENGVPAFAETTAVT